MGITHASITIENTSRNRRIETLALADTGATFLMLPERMARELGFDTQEVETRNIYLADGTRKEVPMIGPITMQFANRTCHVSALVLGDETR